MKATIQSVDPEQILKTRYDIGLFASGYESRCTHLSRLLSADNIARPIVMGFQELKGDRQRMMNDEYLAGLWNVRSILSGSSDDGPTVRAMNACVSDDLSRLHILVDYSSMSRIWYAALLNWVHSLASEREIVIDMVYSFGRYRKIDQQMVIQDIVAVPGCECVGEPHGDTVAVFGLGYYAFAAFCVLDRLEAKEVLAFVSSSVRPPPSPRALVSQEVLEANRDFLHESRAGEPLRLPIENVELAFRYLTELVGPLTDRASVILVPMGPKPHVLASILVAMRYPRVTCLRVSAEREESEDVEADGEILATRISPRSE